jgi:hypothetical protein
MANIDASPVDTTGDVARVLGAGTPRVDREMFSLMWGPTVAAVSVVLDHAEDVIVVRQALETLQLAAKIAAFHHVDEVCFSVLPSLNRYSTEVGCFIQKGVTDMICMESR